MRINTNPFQMLPKKRRGKNISQLILCCQYYLGIKTKDITRKLPISFMNMDRKIPNTSKPNPAAYKELQTMTKYNLSQDCKIDSTYDSQCNSSL